MAGEGPKARVGGMVGGVGASEASAALVAELKARLVPLQQRLDAVKAKVPEADLWLTVAQEPDGTETSVCTDLWQANLAYQDAQMALNRAINAPIPDGVDPTLWLPEKLMIIVLQWAADVPACSAVCRRWRALCNGEELKNHRRAARWLRYARFEPLASPDLIGNVGSNDIAIHENTVCCADGPNVHLFEADGPLPTDVSDVDCYEYHERYVTAVTFAPCGRILYSISDDFEICVWVLFNDSYMTWNLPGWEVHQSLVCAAVAAEGTLFTGDYSGVLGCWEWEYQSWTGFQAHDESINAMIVLPSDLLCTGSRDGCIQIRCTKTYAVKRTLNVESNVYALASAHCPTNLLSGSEDGLVREWDTRTGAELRRLDAGGSVMSLAAWRDKTIVAHTNCRSEGNELVVWDSGVHCRIYTEELTSMAFARNGALITALLDSACIARW